MNPSDDKDSLKQSKTDLRKGAGKKHLSDEDHPEYNELFAYEEYPEENPENSR